MATKNKPNYSKEVSRSIISNRICSDRRRFSYKHVRKRVLERDGYMCRYCFERADTVDHIIPVAYIENHSVANLVACCKRCNSKLGNQVFLSLDDKRRWIEENTKIKGRRITIWTRGEVEKLGHTLRSKILESGVIAKDLEDAEHIAHYLEKLGFEPNIDIDE